ncbi:MAG: glycosyltransferase family 2 protein, partial [Synergistaceae bacterium]|nr:glycosyltransferase family 2 protein [Synergistaceae bacterium]
SDQRPATSDHNTVLVSIIIPAYNTSPYIHRAIESSVRQTHSNIEIIIIDDGSADDTLKVSQSYAEKDSRIRVIHQDNGGVSSARNHGMREANGEYYVFLDSDDWLEDDAVEVLLDAQIAHPDKLIAANYYRGMIDNVKRIANDAGIQSCSLSIEEVAESFCGIWKKGFGMFSFHSLWAKIFRADICKKGIIFPEGIAYSEDAVFVLDYVHETGGAFYINKIVMNILIRSDSATHTTSVHENVLKNLQSQKAAYNLMINHPKNSQQIRKLLIISRSIEIGIYLGKMLKGEADQTELIRAREYMMESSYEFLTCRKISLKRKLPFICKVYFPLPLSKALFNSLQIIKRIRDKMRKK